MKSRRTMSKEEQLRAEIRALQVERRENLREIEKAQEKISALISEAAKVVHYALHHDVEDDGQWVEVDIDAINALEKAIQQ